MFKKPLVQFTRRTFYNRVTLVGRLGKDPEHLTFKNNNTNSNTEPESDGLWKFSLVTNKNVKENDEWKEIATWHTVETKRKLGYLHKGALVIVEGEIYNWVSKEGKYGTSIKAKSVNLIQNAQRHDPE
ncbi:hypothetical protein BC833DRAFT_658630 [Globomyces pollinis-pini]|nr:hypothetical protein BC833DRAFT_658630 [Globomyces pollinis-pini]